MKTISMVVFDVDELVHTIELHYDGLWHVMEAECYVDDFNIGNHGTSVTYDVRRVSNDSWVGQLEPCDVFGSKLYAERECARRNEAAKAEKGGGDGKVSGV